MRTVQRAALLLAFCAALAAAQEGEEKSYGDGAEGLKALWSDVLAKAQAGEEGGVRALLEQMIMGEDDFRAILGDVKGTAIAERHEEKFARLWPGEAKTIVARVKERGYDDVIAEEVAPESAQADDKKILAALKEGTKMYRVRLKKKEEKAGLRYDPFFFVNGQWRIAVRLGKLLAAADKPKKGGSGE